MRRRKKKRRGRIGGRQVLRKARKGSREELIQLDFSNGNSRSNVEQDVQDKGVEEGGMQLTTELRHGEQTPLANLWTVLDINQRARHGWTTSTQAARSNCFRHLHLHSTTRCVQKVRFLRRPVTT